MNKQNIQTEFTPDDPILTAYALGEVENPEQVNAIEKALNENPEPRETVENARQVDSQLTALFATEEKPEVPAYVQSSLEAWPKKKEPTNKARRWQWLFWTAPTLAAACLIAMLGLPAINSSLDKSEPVEEGIHLREIAKQRWQEGTDNRIGANKLLVDENAPFAAAEPMPESEQIMAPAATTAPKPSDTDDLVAANGTAQLRRSSSPQRQNVNGIEREPASRPTQPGGTAEKLHLQEQAADSGNINPDILGGRESKDKALVMEKSDLSVGFAVRNRRLKGNAAMDDFEGSVDSGDFVPTFREGHSKKESVRKTREEWNREGYDHIEENDFTSPRVEPLSTFSIDVDTASYANVRRMLRAGQLPAAGAVRIEELINYFNYEYDAPGKKDRHPLAIHLEGAPAPWNRDHQLVRVALKARDLDWEKRPASNLVFLLDVSGSMNNPNKLGLVKETLSMLVERLDERDRVAIVVYAGSSGLVLDSTSADEQEEILGALDRLQAGGSTNGGAGIELAYKVAQENFLKKGNNCIILCTDGDFNVGVSDRSRLTDLVEAKAKEGVFLTALGFGMGNYKDDMLETLSNKGNGNYGYIDSKREAKKVFVEEAVGTLLTVAKDVKFQIEFNPDQVQAYRLLGYENRLLAAQDFNDDTKDAGEVGAGHSVTALYEIVPHGVEIDLPKIDELKYSKKATTEKNAELLAVKMRYKQPDEDTSAKLEVPLKASDLADEVSEASESFRFASAVAEFGMVLRQSEYLGDGSLSSALARAKKSTGEDEKGYRHEFITLVHTAMELMEQ